MDLRKTLEVMQEVLCLVAGLSEREGPDGKVHLSHLVQGIFCLIAVNTTMATSKDGTLCS